MADFNEPQLTSTYTSFLSTLKGRDTDLAALFANDAVSVSNWPARAVRFNTNSNKFQRRNSANSGFEDLTSNHHFPAITIDGSGTLTVGGNMTLGGNFDGTGNITGNNINVTHVDIPQTGLYRPATNTLGISTNTALAPRNSTTFAVVGHPKAGIITSSFCLIPKTFNERNNAEVQLKNPAE